ncbi:histidine phosphatase family protein [Halalkalibacter nanhaiisediminis]|uniref:Histidine phosphatase superfamily protein (Branch 1) n=1 Tax=Halalkalibacter nanhaiisediminis TaxID=688079 RepID=A0A562QT66_9BACI|nr:histidine phosphatase family protein [Halalkalibacter nanhaiisediminis]TWI59286.1 histidine phosphatase superfamily protein (branch 1) [Halalkalibacter nanhaiisediminis]
MKVGLIRHFRVKRGYPNKIITSEELMKWVDEYDASDVWENEINCQIKWQKCYSSDLPRAKTTAQKACNGEIIYLKELREITFSPLFHSKVKLPLFLNIFFIRIAWMFNHKSQPKSKREVIKQINDTLDKILHDDEDVLIVGHGGMMMFMRKELMKRGFTGPRFNRPENGQVYVFEKE